LYPDADAFHLDPGGKVPQYRLIGRMEIERGRDQQHARGVGSQRDAGEISAAFEVAPLQVPLYAHPVIQGLERQMDVFTGFNLDDDQAAIVVDCEDVGNAARAGGEVRGLAVQGRVANASVQAVG
jgi:hypothetical protein